MCTTCGCSDGAKTTMIDPVTGEHEHVMPDGTVVRHSHDRGHHSHDHSPDQGDGHHHHGHDHHHHGHDHAARDDGSLRAPAPSHEMIHLEQAVLAKNDTIAAQNRGFFAGRETLALNVMSSPGSGKTTLLVRTLEDLKERYPLQVIEGDQETAADAERIKATGAKVIQINTGTGCHLEADMVARGIEHVKPSAGSILFIENVGNLVCPALFDLGEHARVVLFSITEGEDKPLKYPHMFRTADLVLITKIDLLPHLSFDLALCRENVRKVAPNAGLLEVSSTSGEGLSAWYDWLESRHPVRRVSGEAHG